MKSTLEMFQSQAPIERANLSEIVAKQILQMVTSGQLKAGDQIPPERDLAETMGVSRSSVREALRGLAILGVVNTKQGGGAYISELDAEALLGPIRFFLSLENLNVEELYDARSLIEGDVARRAAVSMSAEDIARLTEILEDQEATLENPNLFRASDYKFHELIWIGSKNAFLKRIGESLNSIGLEFRKRASENPNVLQQSYRDHLNLLEAIRERDPDRAAIAAETHMKNVYNSTIGN